ncbi:MAG: hypothetical protein RJA07_1492 [Bacteroidota bacterium]|jgi:shikimate kinase
MRIYLNGFMGCGKTKTGKALAKSLGYLFVDLDNFIEEKTFTSIPLLFNQWGEAYFRTLELEYLQDLLIYENIVIACGGGAITYSESYHFMKQNGTTIYLQHKFETLYNRLNTPDAINKRPLLKALPNQTFKADLLTLFNSRLPFYESCNLTIDASKNEETVIATIKQKMQLSS